MVKSVQSPYFLTLFSLIGSKRIFDSPSTGLEQDNSTREVEGNQLRYPVILVHGIIVHDRWAPIDFWGRIPDILRREGVKVYFGGTDAWGDYQSNAALLKETIDRVLEENQTTRVNIIAHSKGGIDSRYLIWHYGYGDKVASLTTIGSPHRGAEVADLVYSRRLTHTDVSRRLLNLFGHIYGDKNPDIYSLLYQLTTEHMQEFNQLVILDEKVYFQSIYSSMLTSFEDPIFFFSHFYILNVKGENDGLVSEASAAWGPNPRKIPGSLSHADLVDIRKELKRGVNIPQMYLDLIRNLAERGF